MGYEPGRIVDRFGDAFLEPPLSDISEPAVYEIRECSLTEAFEQRTHLNRNRDFRNYDFFSAGGQ
ncbi:hypothetical protein [Halorubrum halophilum]|uniref:hypothetical protein n=1 Tax=Halorubrum halophilum TaxID=413816 RepID=UPI000A72972D|nr:hypothetical protein [Halorubrum halophilum]